MSFFFGLLGFSTIKHQVGENFHSLSPVFHPTTPTAPLGPLAPHPSVMVGRVARCSAEQPQISCLSGFLTTGIHSFVFRVEDDGASATAAASANSVSFGVATRQMTNFAGTLGVGEHARTSFGCSSTRRSPSSSAAAAGPLSSSALAPSASSDYVLGFARGDTVRMVVDMDNKHVQFFVNGSDRGQ